MGERRTARRRRKIECDSSALGPSPLSISSLGANPRPSFVGVFFWQFLPAVIFPGLTSIALLCLADNNNVVLRTLGSAYDGFGLLDFVSVNHCHLKRH
jgi:hypothetical protein